MLVHKELVGGIWRLKFEVSRGLRVFEVIVPANANPLEIDAFLAKLTFTLRQLRTDGGSG